MKYKILIIITIGIKIAKKSGYNNNNEFHS